MGAHPELLSYLKNSIYSITNYPYPLAENMRDKISDVRDVPAESILVTNGAVEAFYLIASLNFRANSLIYTPSFSEYEDACKTSNHKIKFRNNNKFSENENFKNCDVVWIGNPNNPDGKTYPIEKIKVLIEKFPNTLFVIDEAYIDFIENMVSLVPEALKTKNLVVVSSLTKKYVIPGLRLGYFVSHPDIVTQVKSKLMPWRINALAIKAGLFCLSKETNRTLKVEKWLEESKKVQDAIDCLNGFKIHPSETIFFLGEGPVKSSYLKEVLASEYKLLIRDASNFRGLTDYHFRVSVRKPEENQLLINALKKLK
jgi:threonine-phosphate decarboxylase